MTLIITCEIAPGVKGKLEALRIDHLRYIHANRSLIRFGGPARADDGKPETMIIVLDTDNLDTAKRFIANEPYNASGIFEAVRIRTWSQVLPETVDGSLSTAIHEESTRAKA